MNLIKTNLFDNGLRHEIYDTGIEMWWKDDKRHREDGPAVELEMLTEGADQAKLAYEEWWLDGSLHRTDGPAIVVCNSKEWWYHGERLDSKEKVQKFLTDPQVKAENCIELIEKFNLLDEFKECTS